QLPREANCIIATARSKARTAQRFGTPNCATYTTDSCSTAPPKCAISPSSNASRATLNKTGTNNPRRLMGAPLTHLNGQRLLIQRNAEIDVCKHPWLSNSRLHYRSEERRVGKECR